MLCVGGFGLYIWMSVEVSCPARRQTSHCLPAEALPCCCEVRPIAAGSAVLLWSPPRPAVESLCCSGLPWQRQAASAVGVYLLGAGCLGNSGRPSPTEHLRPSARDRLKSWFCSSHWAIPNALSLQSPGLAHCPSFVQSQVQPSQVSGCQFNRAPGQARPVGSAG